MVKYLLSLMLLFSYLVVVVPSQAFTKDKRKTSRYSGVVQEVDRKAKTIFAGRENRNVGLLFEAGTSKFTNIKGLQDLKPGDKIVVEYDAVGGKTIAVTVRKE